MATRKKPGRPRKRVDVCPIGSHGIVSEPAVVGDCVELIYNQPQLLKCIVSIFKEYDADEIIIEFYPDHIIFAGRDHSTRVLIHIVINAADMNLYYFSTSPNREYNGSSPDGAGTSSREYTTVGQIVGVAPAEEQADPEPEVQRSGEAASSSATASSVATELQNPHLTDNVKLYRIVVKRDNLEIVAAIIEKTHFKMMLTLHHDDLSNLFIILSSCEYDSEDCFEITVVPRATAITEAIEIPDLTKYPLEFTLDSHHLRRKISELKKVAQDMIIKKIGTTDLEITFSSVSRVIYTGTYKTALKIKLRSNIAASETFIATMNIGRIRPLMAVNMPGGITFYANHTDPIVIQVGLDQRADNHHAIIARLLINTAH